MNLLPTTNKDELRREYRRRLLVASLLSLAALVFLATIPIFTAYMVVVYKVNNLNRHIGLMEGAGSDGHLRENVDLIKELNRKFTLLDKVFDYGFGGRPTGLFLSFFEKAKEVETGGEGSINLHSFSYGQVVDKRNLSKAPEHVLLISGMASERKGLIHFVKLLESDIRFYSVDLPVSNLIQSKDIKFSVGLKFKVKES